MELINYKDKLSKEELFMAERMFREKVSEISKSAAFSWLLQHEPYCYYEDQLKKLLL